MDGRKMMMNQLKTEWLKWINNNPRKYNDIKRRKRKKNRRFPKRKQMWEKNILLRWKQVQKLEIQN